MAVTHTYSYPTCLQIRVEESFKTSFITRIGLILIVSTSYMYMYIWSPQVLSSSKLSSNVVHPSYWEQLHVCM
jgi:hypothetical protein